MGGSDMPSTLGTVTIRGFKSIERLEGFALGPLNVLIGANGAGKSNFIEFLRLARAVARGEIDAHLEAYGPAEGFYHRGPRRAARIEGELAFGEGAFTFAIEPDSGGGVRVTSGGDAAPVVAAWTIHHFNDTALTAAVRRGCPPGEHTRLEAGGANLPAFLATLRDREPQRYGVLLDMVRRVAPYIESLALDPIETGAGPRMQIRWRQADIEEVLPPGLLSDGTVRFICLAAALLQPEPPATMVIDEPELGLHPDAIAVLGGLIRSASARTQMIVATQSPLLLSEFEAGAVIAVDQERSGSRFRRIDAAAVRPWLEEYSLGELWMKSMLHGHLRDV